MAASIRIKLSPILFLAIFFPYSEADLRHPKETEMSLYLHDWSGVWPNATVVEITGKPGVLPNFTKFGAVFCGDDSLTVGLDKSSTQVARGQGVFVTSALDGSRSLLVMSIVFTNGTYKGSTLQIQGSNPQFEQVAEVAVVGGTGVFRFARGYAILDTIRYDPALHYTAIRCNVTVMHY